MMKFEKKTIIARSTPAGEGALATVRISGEDTLSVLSKIFVPKNPLYRKGNLPVKYQVYGEIIEPDTDEVIDSCTVIYGKKPHTYTGEDTAEITTHGSMVIVKKVLQSCMKTGCVLAEPGEFTKIAFLNGKMDLAQAEAVCEIIRAKTDLAHKFAVKNLQGDFSHAVNHVRENLIMATAEIEARLDFPEDDVAEISNTHLLDMLSAALEKIRKIIDTTSHGRIFLEGARILITGKPNVGKSSLFNDLVGIERAIVSPHPGTTRDFIETTLDIKGIPATFIDTAGIRDTANEIESIGIEKAFEEIKNADLILFLIDAAAGIDNDDILAYQKIKDKNFLIILNKTDIVDKELSDIKKSLDASLSDKQFIKISALEKNGISILEEKISETLTGMENSELNMKISEESFLIANMRQVEKLIKTEKFILESIEGIKSGRVYEFIAIDLRGALVHLDEILGTDASENILDLIFSKFCIGK